MKYLLYFIMLIISITAVIVVKGYVIIRNICYMIWHFKLNPIYDRSEKIWDTFLKF